MTRYAGNALAHCIRSYFLVPTLEAVAQLETLSAVIPAKAGI